MKGVDQETGRKEEGWGEGGGGGGGGGGEGRRGGWELKEFPKLYEVCAGTVRKVESFGVFVELDDFTKQG